MKQRHNNQLTNRNMIALVRWIEQNLDRLHGLTRTNIAEQATAALEFKVTPGNIDGACEAGELTIEPPRRGGNASSDSYTRAYFLAHALSTLYSELGVMVPEYLRLMTLNHPNDEVRDAFNLRNAK